MGFYDWTDEFTETTTTTTVEDNDEDADRVLVQKLGAVLEALFNIELYRLQIHMDEMEVRAEKGDEIAKGVDVAAYRAAADEQLSIVKRVLGRR